MKNIGQQNNPFLVTPAEYDVSPVLAGIGGIAERQRTANAGQRMRDDLVSAYQSGDPDQVAMFIASNPQAQQAMTSALQFRSDATQGDYLNTMRQILSIKDQFGEPVEGQDTSMRDQRVADLLDKRVEFVRAQGGEPVDTIKAMEDFKANPEGFLKNVELGYASMAPKQEWEAYKTTLGGDLDPEFAKEERKYASQVVNDVNKKAGDLRSAYGKVEGLRDQAMGGSRQARAGMIINVARLLSPGIVTDKDFQALTGGADPIQTTMAYIADKNADVGNMLASYVDPLGQSFDGDALLGVARSALLPEAQSLFDRYSDAETRAQTAKMKAGEYDTMFSGRKNLDELNSLLAGDQAPGDDMAPGAPAPAPAQAPAPVTPAPAGAVEKLRANPELADFFLKKYGYLPEGF